MKIDFKATFDMEERDDRLKLNCLIKADDLAIALWNICHNNKHVKDKDALIEKINLELEILNINLDELTY